MVTPFTPDRRPARVFSASRIVLFLLCLMYLLTYVVRMSVSTSSSVFERDLHLSKTQVGFVFSAFAYPYVLFQMVGGYLGDRFGPRRVLSICALIWAGSTIFTGFVGGFAAMVVARVLLGFGESAAFPAATSAMSVWTKPADRGFSQGITHAFAQLGNAITPPLIVGLMAWSGWRGSFFVIGAGSLVWVVVWYAYFRDNPADHRGVSKAELADMPSFAGRSTHAGKSAPWGALIVRMLPVTFVHFCYGWTLWLFMGWLPQFIRNRQQLDLAGTAWFSALLFLAGVAGSALGGVFTDWVFRRTGDLKKARVHLVVAFFLCTLLCMLPVFFTNRPVPLGLGLGGAFFFTELLVGPMWSIPMDIAPRYSGMACGIMNTGSAIAAILSPVVFGYIVDKTRNWSLPFAGSMILCLAGAIVAFWMKPEKPFIVPSDPPSPRCDSGTAIPVAGELGS